MLNHKTIITIILLVMGFSFAGGRSDKEVTNKEQTAIQSIDTTKLEKYERKVIIKAKVGARVGEIGIMGGPDNIGPTGIAADSIGNIYVLDGLNNRILKYSNESKLTSVINLMVPSGCQLYEYDVNNQLSIGRDGNFYIIGLGRTYAKTGQAKFAYDRLGNLLAKNVIVPEPELNTRVLTVKAIHPLPNLWKMKKDTFLLFYCENPRGDTCTVRLPLRKKEGGHLGYVTCLGWDRDYNIYFRIVVREDIPVWPVRECMERSLTRDEWQIIIKVDEKGNLKTIVEERTPGIGVEFWTLGGDGALYLLKYSFNLVVTDELPDWVKNDPNMPLEEKKKWRREYMVPEGYVYVVKFSKVEEK